MIITIDIVVDNTRIYYINAYANIDTIESNSYITLAIYLEIKKLLYHYQ